MIVNVNLMRKNVIQSKNGTVISVEVQKINEVLSMQRGLYLESYYMCSWVLIKNMSLMDIQKIVIVYKYFW